jgi:hypothetical protein
MIAGPQPGALRLAHLAVRAMIAVPAAAVAL